MKDKLLNLLGIARRAGKITMGMDPVKSSIAKGETRVVLVARDFSSRSASGIESVCEEWGQECLHLGQSMDEIGMAIGKRVGVISVNDAGFAKKVRELCRFENEGGTAL